LSRFNLWTFGLNGGNYSPALKIEQFWAGIRGLGDFLTYILSPNPPIPAKLASLGLSGE
jgi:hypothetical protein